MITKPLALYNFFNKHPERWTQYAEARDKDGKGCGPHNSGAVCFCILGACHKLNIPLVDLEPLRKLVGTSAFEFNDHATTTHDILVEKLHEAGV